MIKRFEASVDRLYEKLDGLYHKYQIVFDIFFYFCFVAFIAIAILCDGEKTIRVKVLLKPFVKQFAKILDWYFLPILAGLSLLFEFKDKKLRLITFFSLYILMLYQITSDQQIVAIIPHCNLFYFGGACLIVAAKGKDFKKIGWAYVVTASICMITVTVLAVTGVITDVVLDFGWRLARHSYGMSYPINYPAHWLAVMLVFCYLKNGFLKIWHYIAGIILLCVAIFSCKAMTSSALMVMLLVGTLYRQICYSRGRHRLFGDEKKNRVLVGGMKLSYLIMAVVMIGGAWLYVPPISDIFQEITLLRSVGERFGYGRIGLMQYFPSLLGISYPTSDGPDYFWIDSSYIMVLLKCGIVIFTIVLISLCHIMQRLAKERQIYALCLMVIIALGCAMEHHIMEICFNLFWMMMFTETLGEKNKATFDL